MWLVCTDLKYVEEVQIIFLLLSVVVIERNCLTTLELFNDVTVATTSKMIYSQLPCQIKLSSSTSPVVLSHLRNL